MTSYDNEALVMERKDEDTPTVVPDYGTFYSGIDLFSTNEVYLNFC